MFGVLFRVFVLLFVGLEACAWGVRAGAGHGHGTDVLSSSSFLSSCVVVCCLFSFEASVVFLCLKRVCGAGGRGHRHGTDFLG